MYAYTMLLDGSPTSKHRYINFTFNEAGGGCQNTGTLAKFGQKTGTFSYVQYILTNF